MDIALLTTTRCGAHSQDMPDDPIADRLAAAQNAYLAGTSEVAQERRDAVEAALKAGWTRYRIARFWGVHDNTITAIVKTIEKGGER